MVRAVALIWHGRGPRESRVLEPLKERLHAAGHLVLVPDWDSSVSDGGRSVLLESMMLAAEQAVAHGAPLVVAGWSLGGSAAISLALSADPVERLAGVVGLAPGVADPSPLTGTAPLESTCPLAVPVSLVHGRRDQVVDVQQSERFRRRHRKLCSLEVVDTDHAGVIGTRYDPSVRLCVPTQSPDAVEGLAAAAEAIDDMSRGSTAR